MEIIRFSKSINSKGKMIEENYKGNQNGKCPVIFITFILDHDKENAYKPQLATAPVNDSIDF
jgi:hypothetical protein